MTNFANAPGIPRVLLCRADEPKTQLPPTSAVPTPRHLR
jgi:hypothetical protein